MTDSILDPALKKLLKPYKHNKLFCIQMKGLLKNQYHHEIISRSTRIGPEILTVDETMKLTFKIYEQLLPMIGSWVGVQPMISQTTHTHRLQMKTLEVIEAEREVSAPGARRLSLELVKDAVVSEEQSYQAKLHEMTGNIKIKISKDLINALASEIVHEESKRILSAMIALAIPEDGEIEHIKIKHPNDLAIKINQKSSKIAQETRRGCGNFIIVSPAVLTVLQIMTGGSFVRSHEEKLEKKQKKLKEGNIKFCGTLNSTMRVYCNPYGIDGDPIDCSKDTVIVGYKGSSETDTGYIFCPEIAVIEGASNVHSDSTGAIRDLNSRHGRIEFSNIEGMSNGKNYYKLLTVDCTDAFMFPLGPEEEEEPATA